MSYIIPVAFILAGMFLLCVWCCLVVGSKDDDVNNRG